MKEIKKPVQARIIFTYEQDFENFITEFKIEETDYIKKERRSPAIFVDFNKISRKQLGVAVTRYLAQANPI